MLRLLEEIGRREPGYDLSVRNIVTDLLLLSGRFLLRNEPPETAYASPMHKKISEVIRYLNSHYAEPVTLAKLSETFFVSPYYLSRSFKEVSGFALTDYLNLTRIKEAQRLLRSTRLPVTEIAARVGFESFSHFGKMFKKYPACPRGPTESRHPPSRERTPICKAEMTLIRWIPVFFEKTPFHLPSAWVRLFIKAGFAATITGGPIRLEGIHRENATFYSGIHDAAAHVIELLSRLLEVNTIFVASNDGVTNVIMNAFNRREELVKENDCLPFELSYCSLVLHNDSKPLLIPDTASSPLTSSMAVTQALGSRSFIGVPILLKNGTAYGTVCALDSTTYRFSETDITALQSMAVFLAHVIELENTVSELKKTEKKLKEANQAVEGSVQLKSNLLATIGSEIRAPITSIMGATDLLGETPLLPDQQEYIEIIQMSNHSLLSLVDNILYYSRLEAKDMKAEHEPFDLVSAVDTVIRDFQAEAAEKSIQLELATRFESLPVIVGDERKLRQALSNILRNALDFTSRGRIDVCARVLPNSGEPGSYLLKFEVRGGGSASFPIGSGICFISSRNLSRREPSRTTPGPSLIWPSANGLSS
ncbi:helix-turn-helix domain-containing protein [Paenibacillus sp. CC-CFT747]|nr:helix-turn-helix domain-containing protein [Paenibacillus sp. CC-CFT747]